MACLVADSAARRVEIDAHLFGESLDLRVPARKKTPYQARPRWACGCPQRLCLMSETQWGSGAWMWLSEHFARFASVLFCTSWSRAKTGCPAPCQRWSAQPVIAGGAGGALGSAIFLPFICLNLPITGAVLSCVSTCAGLSDTKSPDDTFTDAASTFRVAQQAQGLPFQVRAATAPSTKLRRRTAGRSSQSCSWLSCERAVSRLSDVV